MGWNGMGILLLLLPFLHNSLSQDRSSRRIFDPSEADSLSVYASHFIPKVISEGGKIIEG